MSGEVLARFFAQKISPEVALMELLIAHEDVGSVQTIATRANAEPIVRLLAEHPERCARIVAMLRAGVDSSEPLPTAEAGIAFCRRLFDWSVQQSEEASVALYSLGSPEILRRATDEVVAVLELWQLLGRTRRVLDLGCGIGRFLLALSPLVAEAHGIDVSAKMIEVAERRCAGLTNVTLAHCSGHDLQEYPDARFDLILAVDSFPYLVQSGLELVRRHFAEAARVLTPGGDFVILNFSYRDPADDLIDVAALSRANGFELVVGGARPFALWSGLAFHLRRSGASTINPTAAMRSTLA